MCALTRGTGQVRVTLPRHRFPGAARSPVLVCGSEMHGLGVEAACSPGAPCGTLCHTDMWEWELAAEWVRGRRARR